MKKIVLLVACTCILVFAKAQTTKSLVSLKKIDLGLQGIGFSYELKSTTNFTFDLCAGAGGGYDIYEGGQFAYYPLKPALYLSLAPKYFYNFQKRISKEKNTQLNSANYFGISIKYVKTFAPQIDAYQPISPEVVLMNIHWGIQRAIGGHWLFNFQSGVGYAIDAEYEYGTIYPALDVKFAYVLGKKRIK
jgi:hypothetical protein